MVKRTNRLFKICFSLLIIVLLPIKADLSADDESGLIYKAPDITPAIKLYQNIIRNREANCLFTDTAKEMPGLDIQEDSRFNTLFMSNVYCEFLKEVEKVVEPFYKKIIATGEIPFHAYMFSIFVLSINDEGENIYTKEDIGLFPTFTSCKLLEEYAKRDDIPVKKCRRVDDFFRYQIE